MKRKNIIIIFTIMLTLKILIIEPTTYISDNHNNSYHIDILHDIPSLNDISTTN